MGHSRELIPTPHSLFGNKKLGGVPHVKHTNEKVNIAIGMVLFDNHSRREVAKLAASSPKEQNPKWRNQVITRLLLPIQNIFHFQIESPCLYQSDFSQNQPYPS